MWKFEKKGKYYKIRSCKYKNRVFSKWGSGNGDWGTYKDVNAKNQFWLLKPRFNATVSQSQIWGVDNRQGSKAFVEKKVVTQGLKLTKSSSISTKRSLEFSLDAVIPSSVPTKIGLKMKSQIKTSLKKSSEKTWSSKSTITFTAPKGKNYRVTQFVVTFKSEIPGDAMALYGSYKVEETTGALPKLSKVFSFSIINILITKSPRNVQPNQSLLIQIIYFFQNLTPSFKHLAHALAILSRKILIKLINVDEKTTIISKLCYFICVL